MKDEELKLLSDYNNIPNNNKNSFLSNIDSDVKYNICSYKCEYDFSWLDVIEDTAKYIENIINNPKVFILNEEEVVVIEKTKKISVESVIHLTQHSNLVSDYNNKTGEIRPSKILNVTREETMDIYENRFIFTLINKTIEFIEKYGSLAANTNDSVNNRSLNYTAKTKYADEHVNIKLNIESIENTNALNKQRMAKTSERIKNVRDRYNSFRGSYFYKTLKSLGVLEVKSPIKKTNIILKNPNFQRAEYLWGFLERFDKNVKKESRYAKSYSNNIDLASKLNTSFLINYSIFDLKNLEKNDYDIEKINRKFMEQNIKNFLSYDTFINEEDFLKIMRNEYRSVRKEQEKNFKEIKKIIDTDINAYDKAKFELEQILKS